MARDRRFNNNVRIPICLYGRSEPFAFGWVTISTSNISGVVHPESSAPCTQLISVRLERWALPPNRCCSRPPSRYAGCRRLSSGVSRSWGTVLDRQKVAAALQARGVRLPCPRCGNNKFTVLDGYAQYMIQPEITGGTRHRRADRSRCACCLRKLWRHNPARPWGAWPSSYRKQGGEK